MGLGLKLRITNTRDNTTIERAFDRFPVRVGRNALNDMQLEFPFVSQFHAVLELTNGALMLRDLGSKNGTLLRGTGRVPPNTVVDLAATNYEFAIVTLIFQASPYNVEAGPVAAKKRHGTVLSMSVSDVSGAQGQAPGGGPTQAIPSIAMMTPSGGTEQPVAIQIKPLYDGYRAAWANVYKAIYSAAGSLDNNTRGQLLKRLMMEQPALMSEPDFQRLAAHFGANISLPPTAGGAASKEEAVALQGLKELAAWYIPGGRPLEGVPDVVGFLQKLQDTLDVFLKCFVPLRDGYKQFEKDLNVKKTVRPGGAPAAISGPSVENARDPRELAARLLDWKDASNEGPRAIESTFADLMIHQVAMLNGVMKGVKSLLAELSPQQLEKALDDPRSKKTGIFANRYKALWEMYAERHSDLADEEKEAFGLIFGPQFVSAYSQLAGEHLGGHPPGASQIGGGAAGHSGGFPQNPSASMPPPPYVPPRR